MDADARVHTISRNQKWLAWGIVAVLVACSVTAWATNAVNAARIADLKIEADKAKAFDARLARIEERQEAQRQFDHLLADELMASADKKSFSKHLDDFLTGRNHELQRRSPD